ncbi:MAG: heme-binding domain-containing protein [Chitinophaga sp.]|uniref:heme-binding domain-containing protein n=1 Tax=Chitinophaga sp. TaxID=1869181 RepID=UPI001B184268|nr:heme-binding domain-containing protein [Chitinophaga sp.]MBO9729586.1 heme-binding domain-containing protein [Chitinophaga sp.]
MRKLIIVPVLLLIIFGVVQFIRPPKNQSADHLATAITERYPVPADVQALLQNACYDCHSNNTRYPWYTNIQPIGWWMAHHISKGKKEFNFDEYGTYSAKRQRNKLKRMKEQIITGKMPLRSYTLMHADARLNADQQRLLTQWIDSVLAISGHETR